MDNSERECFLQNELPKLYNYARKYKQSLAPDGHEDIVNEVFTRPGHLSRIWVLESDDARRSYLRFAVDYMAKERLKRKRQSINLDDTAMLVIVAPLYVPLVGELGFDLIWYGVLYTITTQIAYMTPPFGYNLFLMRAMAPPEITLRDIYSSILPFVLVMVVALATIMAFPEIALWLPGVVYGN